MGTRGWEGRGRKIHASLISSGFHMLCSSWCSTAGTDQGMQQCPTACWASCSQLKPAGKHPQMPRQSHTCMSLSPQQSTELAVAARHSFPRAIPAPGAGQHECHQHSGNGICTSCTSQSPCVPLLGHTCIDKAPIKGQGHPLPPEWLSALQGCTHGSSGMMAHCCPPSLPRATSQGQDLSPFP